MSKSTIPPKAPVKVRPGRTVAAAKRVRLQAGEPQPPKGKNTQQPQARPGKQTPPAKPVKQAKAAAPAVKPVPAKARGGSPAKPAAKRAKLPGIVVVGAKPARKHASTKAKIAPRTAKTKHKQLSIAEHDVASKPLTANEQRFAEEYLIDLNGTQAYKRVFPNVTDGSARVLAVRLLAKVNVSEKVALLKQERSSRLQLDADLVLREANDIYFADARELVEHWVGCCRFCWGERHLYQRTDGELDHDRETHEAKQDDRPEGRAARPFNKKGGGGFHAAKSPNPDCPNCAGAGHGRTVVRDTRTMSRRAVALYAGVKEGKDGIEVKVHDKMSAGDKMFRHLGLYEIDNRQKAAEFTSREALQVFADRMAESRERQQAMLEERGRMGLTGD